MMSRDINFFVANMLQLFIKKHDKQKKMHTKISKKVNVEVFT